MPANHFGLRGMIQRVDHQCVVAESERARYQLYQTGTMPFWEQTSGGNQLIYPPSGGCGLFGPASGGGGRCQEDDVRPRQVGAWRGRLKESIEPRPEKSWGDLRRLYDWAATLETGSPVDLESFSASAGTSFCCQECTLKGPDSSMFTIRAEARD